MVAPIFILSYKRYNVLIVPSFSMQYHPSNWYINDYYLSIFLSLFGITDYKKEKPIHTSLRDTVDIHGKKTDIKPNLTTGNFDVFGMMISYHLLLLILCHHAKQLPLLILRFMVSPPFDHLDLVVNDSISTWPGNFIPES